MDAFNPFFALSPELIPAESSSTSECSTTIAGARYSEVEVMLSSRNPKKRSGRKKFKETRHPVYRGVRLRNSGKWICEVREPNKKSRVWLGTYATPEMAARAHDVAVLAMRGRSACLNFADSVWRLPLPESSNVKDIQKAAAAAAEGFRATEEVVESPEIVVYVDEETVFGIPAFLDSMAEGLMVPPPQTMGYCNFGDDVDFDGDVSLWSF